jgi:hypothetical protein
MHFDQQPQTGASRRSSVHSPAMTARIFQRAPVEKWARERLLDEAFERYLDWRAESDAVREAYGAWSRASVGETALPFAAYGAALDREQRAAALYGSVIGRVERLVGEPAAGARQGATRI